MASTPPTEFTELVAMLQLYGDATARNNAMLKDIYRRSVNRMLAEIAKGKGSAR